jgi:hypothetical protein
MSATAWVRRCRAFAICSIGSDPQVLPEPRLERAQGDAELAADPEPLIAAAEAIRRQKCAAATDNTTTLKSPIAATLRSVKQRP